MMPRLSYPIGVTAALATVMLLLNMGCNTPASPSSPQAQGQILQSEGLGLTRSDWEGRRNHSLIGSFDSYEYSYGRHMPPFSGYQVIYWQQGEALPTARIVDLYADTRLVLSDTGRISSADAEQIIPTIEQMHTAVRMLLPADAQFLSKTDYPGHQGTFAETYSSKSLASLYPPLPSLGSPWGDDTPGTIRITYSHGGPFVSLEIGNSTLLLAPKSPTISPPTAIPTPTPGIPPSPFPTRPAPISTSLRPTVPIPIPTVSKR